MLDCAAAEADRGELATSDNSVLTEGDRRNGSVGW
jgi:hypothetical protein